MPGRAITKIEPIPKDRRAIVDPLGTEGAIFTEYAVVVGVCGLAIAFAILMMGTALSTAYYQNRQIVIAPVP